MPGTSCGLDEREGGYDIFDTIFDVLFDFFIFFLVDFYFLLTRLSGEKRDNCEI